MSYGIYKNKVKYGCIISFGIVSLLMLLLFFYGDYAPFGDNSLTWEDGNIQYLDFFSYFKDVLSGENSLIYTFSKTLGGSNIAVFSYYLASPFNLLIIFFEKAELNSFFDILILLKLSLAGGTCAFFLNKRFSYFVEKNKYTEYFVILLSIC